MKKMKFLTALVILITFASCSSDDDSTTSLDVETAAVSNLAATQTTDYTTTPPSISGEYTRFSFATGTTTTGDDWDIAFRGTTILVNGGEETADDQPARTANARAYIATGSLAEITEVNTAMLSADSATEGLAITTGSGNGWYSYNPENHIISPIAGKVIVVETVTGAYAKVEIISYYKDGDTASDSQYYTFNYVYNPNVGETSF